MRHPFLTGNRIYLRGIEKEDLSGRFFEWANDKEVTQFLYMGAFPNNLENLEKMFEDIKKNDTDIAFMIVDKDTDREVGFCGFHRVLWVHKNAEYRIFLGEKDYWGKGYGREATKMMLRYGFELLNLNRVWLGVNSEHKRAVNSYRKCGFVDEGVLRQDIYRNSKYYDNLRMGILREEYYAKFKSEFDKEIPNIFEKK